MKKLAHLAMREHHPNYNIAVKRLRPLYGRAHDIRTPFGRDYTRIIFSQAYRRMKNKTQVFFAVDNDHVCTRSEHVNLVESVSYTIANALGLNTELTKAIAVGHDLGHAPFGHGGESIISDISVKHGLDRFWHERNSLHFVDKIELLDDASYHKQNLDLTYAVRDGIISHCGEMRQKLITPRNDPIDLSLYTTPGQYDPYTYEGCVVKMADKIAYLARDIEDALTLGIITPEQVNTLKKQLNKDREIFTSINNGTVVNYFIMDVVENSSEEGIGLSDEAFDVMHQIMDFNYKNIYIIKRVKVHTEYVKLILNSLFNILYDCGEGDLITNLKQEEPHYPKLIGSYLHWLEKYSNLTERDPIYQNILVYDFNKDKYSLVKSILDYIAGMTDTFLVQAFNELLSFK